MSGIINMSEAAILALHSMALIAKQKNRVLNIKEIAKELNASENHLSKVMQRLAKSGFVTSTRGPKGGFLLYKKSSDITFLDIYEAIEGKFIIQKCMLNKSKCSYTRCILDNLNNDFSVQFINHLKNNNLNSVLE